MFLAIKGHCNLKVTALVYLTSLFFRLSIEVNISVQSVALFVVGDREHKFSWQMVVADRK
jgi:hypothetical protein